MFKNLEQYSGPRKQQPNIDFVVIALSWQDKPLAEFSTLEVAAYHTMHLPHSIAVRPNLELKTRPKQLLGSLPLDITLPGLSNDF
jgi:hypothetical protein